MFVYSRLMDRQTDIATPQVTHGLSWTILDYPRLLKITFSYCLQTDRLQTERQTIFKL